MAKNESVQPALGGQEWLIGALTQLQVRYLTLIHHVSRGRGTLDIWFYIEDLAILCSEALLGLGVPVELHDDRPKVVSLLADEICHAGAASEAVDGLEQFLRSVAKSPKA